MMIKKILFFLPLIIICSNVFSQQENEKPIYVENTFSATRLVIGQSSEIAKNGDMNLDIQHHFGPVNSGFYDFFGFDQAATRIGFHYSINDWLNVGIGRTTVEKTWDGSVKLRILRQKTNESMPVSLTYFGNVGINSMKWQDNIRTNYFSSRLSYVNQLIIARKFGEKLSVQIVPSYIHRNLVEKNTDDNDVFTIGAGFCVQLSKHINLNAEYHYIVSKQTSNYFNNSFSIGIDINTSGHVFQVFLSNSQGLLEQHYLPATKGKWTNGDIHLGFNITRVFEMKQKDYF